MMHETFEGRATGFPLRSGRMSGLWIAAAYSMGAAWCSGAEPTNAPPDKTDADVALSRSVSLDAAGQTGPIRPEAGAAVPAGSSSANPALQTAPGAASPTSSADAKPRTPRRSILPPRRRARAAATNGTDGVAKDRAPPWYQTGLGSLGVVLAVVGACVWVVRRWVPAARSGGSSAMRVAGRVNLTPKHSIALVHVGRRYVLVGLAGDRMTTLCELSDPDEVADIAARVNGPGTRPRGDFDDLLRGESTGFRLTTTPTGEDTKPVRAAVGGGRRLTGLEDLVDRLKSLQKK